MQAKLSHLSSEDIEILMKRYYAGEVIKSLLQEYKIVVAASNLHLTFPPKIHEDLGCPYCELHLISSRPSKNGVRQVPFCPVCRHTELGNCNCSNCAAIRRQQEQERLKQLRQNIEKFCAIADYKPILFEGMSLVDSIQLGAMLRVGISEDYEFIYPLSKQQQPYSPDYSDSIEILNRFSERRYLTVHPLSEIDAFAEIEAHNLRYYTTKVIWHINLFSETLTKKEIITNLMNPTLFKREQIDELFEIWYSIALQEVLEYFLHSIKSVFKSDYNVGAKTIEVFKDLLKHFSVSQIYAIIYKGTNDALRFYTEEKVNQKYAINTIIGRCQNYGERAIASKWNLKGFGRIGECPQSALSKFIYDRVLRLPEDGFYTLIDKSKIVVQE